MFEAFVCTMVFVSIIATIAGIITGLTISYLLQNNEFVTSFSAIPIALGAVFGIVAFVMTYQYPQNEKLKRKSKIAEEMAYFSGYMGTLASSGLTLEGIFRTIAIEQTNEEIVKDAQHLTRDLELLGMDIENALKDLSDRSPLDTYTEFLEGIISNLEVGGNLKDYFVASGEVQLEQRKNRIREANQSLGIVTEIYTILLIVFPLLGAIMLSIMGMMSVNLYNFSIISLMNILTYVFVPAFGIIMILMIDSLIPKR
ncbi:type II secretion system F family protein [Nitrosopumilus sp. b2]|uniref:type II secretion system F family protein n=1 Tax=Nitrosopumilus sp. b2 TaxID=2109908 RepID=UPI0021074E61|nr:type II secretion system F family protein [Nitrosopumilus sp. b2]